MSTLQIQTAKVFEPLLKASRYKGAYGGRGSGKSHWFAEAIVERCIVEPGSRVVCIREVQKSLTHSSKQLIEDKIQALGVGHLFDVQEKLIKGPGDSLIIFQGMQNHTAESIKSLERFNVAWIEEAQALSARSFSMLRPTIRAPGSEIWASWNPTRKSDAIDEFFRRQEHGDDVICVAANWRDNPWFPQELEAERVKDFELYPERYDHIWEGGYAKAFEGAYFAKELNKAKLDGRIGVVSADPLLPIKLFFDIGGSGHTSDAMAIWAVQFVGQEIRVLDYMEGQSQVLGYYTNELRKRGFQDAVVYLPHDGIRADLIVGKRVEGHLRDAGFEVKPSIPNQGKGAAMMRVDAVRRLFPKMWFNEATTEAGRDALGFYHEKRDPERNVGLGPEHDWSSHAADAFGLMAIVYEEPSKRTSFNRVIQYPNRGVV